MVHFVNLLIQWKTLVFAMHQAVEPIGRKVFAEDADTEVFEHGDTTWNSFRSNIKVREWPVVEVGVNYERKGLRNYRVKQYHREDLNHLSSVAFRISFPRPWFMFLYLILLNEWKLVSIEEPVICTNQHWNLPAGAHWIQNGKHGCWRFLTFWYEPFVALSIAFFKILEGKNTVWFSILVMIRVHAMLVLLHESRTKPTPEDEDNDQLTYIKECPSHAFGWKLIPLDRK